MVFYKKSPGQVLVDLGVDKDKGLSEFEVKKRVSKFGLNRLKEKEKVNPLVLFLNQFRSFIIYILIFAVGISILSNEMTEAIIILIILVFNAVFGFVQEYRAEKSIEALSKISALKSRVVRDGKVVKVDAVDLVPGDVILLEEGDKIPADCRILECKLFQTAEAALTGESTSVSKNVDVIKKDVTVADRKNMVFSGTLVASGKARCVVCKTGMSTEIGKIADMISTAKVEMTPLQKKLEEFGKWVGNITLAICFLVFVVGVYKEGLFGLLFAGEFSMFVVAGREWFLTAVSLAVAAVPEGLPAIVTIALAIGVKKMVSSNALIRKLPSVETLGETTIICTDKTGTLTKNQMTVRRVWTRSASCEVAGSGYNPQGSVDGSVSEMLFRIGAVCSDATLFKDKGVWKITGDPTEGALVVSAKKYGMDFEKERSLWKKVDEVPFDSVRKLMSVVGDNGKKKVVFTKGAPEEVLAKCNFILDGGKVRKISKKDRDEIILKNNEYADEALRVLGFAYKDFTKGDIESNLVFVGLQAMLDPPHPDVRESIAKCHSAGIRVIMITGDNRHTACGIARKIGIEGDSIRGGEFEEMTDLQKLKCLETTNIFARVEPRHKMEIVKILQGRGEVVAMTGDGVNDAPAIKKADMGIAMGINGTDVAKESSEMILLDDKFTSIVSAIEEGRGIYENIKKFINYLFSSNLAEVMLIFFAIAFGFPLPMTAIMLLWLNLITDGLPALALSVDPYSKNLMSKKPKKSSDQIMDRAMIFNVVYVASLIAGSLLFLMSWTIGRGFADEHVQTLVFTGIIMMELVRLQAIRSSYDLGTFSNRYLVWAVVGSLSLQLLVVYSPLARFFGTVALDGFDWFLIFAATLFVYVFNVAGQKVRDFYGWFE